MQLIRTFLAAFVMFVAMAGLPGLAEAARVEIIINRIGQKMTVKVDGRTKYVWPISSGASGYTTPSGKYKPFRMEADHFSKEWDNAPMPHSIFFTERGHAIHGTIYEKSLGRPVSHGCVRLSQANAATLFALVGENGMSNTQVVVRGGFFDFGSTPRRSFASVGDDIDRTISAKAAKPWWTRTTVKKKAEADKDSKKKPKKVAQKCTTKNGKKVCKKAFTLFGGDQG
jgi:hypothetical protein